MSAATLPETRPWTLAQLAGVMLVHPDSLRQRIHRGTLVATKVGTTWVVPHEEALRVIAAASRRRGSALYVAKAAARARAIVAQPRRRQRRRGVDQHGGRA